MKDLPHKRTRLGNGLEVVVTPQPQLHRAHVAMYVRVGSRFETRKTNGLSHFLEHMLYRGTTESLGDAHEVNLAFEDLGGYLYAATHADFGVFSVTLPPPSLTKVCPLFAEVLTVPAFRDIEIEKGIVHEEILEDLDDEGRQVDADNLIRSLVYPKHALGYTITGDAKQVDSFDEAGLRAHHTRHYHSRASVLAFSGRVDPDECFALAERWFGRYPTGEPVVTNAPLHSQKRPRLSVVENMSSQTELRMSLRAFADADPKRPALDLLMRVIDDGMATRLYHRVCDSQGLCYDVSAGFDSYEDDGLVDFTAGVQHDRVAKVAEEILAVVTDIAHDGIPDQELERAKRRSAWDLEVMLDSSEEAAGFLAGGILFGRFETLTDRVAAQERITTEDVRAVAREIAHPSRLNVVAVGLLEPGVEAELGEKVKGWRGA